ncbi:MAG: hypothetical protein IPK26_09300 [Planctomycetes bacterium]|nr:hypothetical protein [Planctomycetota bacterium]
MATPSIVVRGLLLGAVAASYALTCLGGTAAAPGAGTQVGSLPVVPVVVPAEPLPAVSSAPAAPAAAMARFPGGHTLRALNGIAESVDMPWPADHAWSPVEGVVRDQGQDWYRHADGSWSTTTVDPSDPRHSIGLVFTPAAVRPAALRGQ